jgi:hypothetical protein
MGRIRSGGLLVFFAKDLFGLKCDVKHRLVSHTAGILRVCTKLECPLIWNKKFKALKVLEFIVKCLKVLESPWMLNFLLDQNVINITLLMVVIKVLLQRIFRPLFYWLKKIFRFLQAIWRMYDCRALSRSWLILLPNLVIRCELLKPPFWCPVTS